MRRLPRSGRRAVIRTIALASTVLLAASCDGEPEPTIVGRWQLVEGDGRIVIEFRADGSYLAVTDAGRFSGQWTVLDDGRLATWSDASRPRRINRYRFDGEVLVIEGDSGPARRHRRL